jgi:hypothetical protein
MNRNLVHELLIERVSAGDMENGREIEDLIYTSRNLEAQI